MPGQQDGSVGKDTLAAKPRDQFRPQNPHGRRRDWLLQDTLTSTGLPTSQSTCLDLQLPRRSSSLSTFPERFTHGGDGGEDPSWSRWQFTMGYGPGVDKKRGKKRAKLGISVCLLQLTWDLTADDTGPGTLRSCCLERLAASSNHKQK